MGLLSRGSSGAKAANAIRQAGNKAIGGGKSSGGGQAKGDKK